VQITVSEAGATHALWHQFTGLILVVLIARVWLQAMLARLHDRSVGDAPFAHHPVRAKLLHVTT